MKEKKTELSEQDREKMEVMVAMESLRLLEMAADYVQKCSQSMPPSYGEFVEGLRKHLQKKLGEQVKPPLFYPKIVEG